MKDDADANALQASQASSHHPLQPVSAAILAEQEASRRNAARHAGPCRTGCAEIDTHVLVGGGFERGTGVGISSEDDGFAVRLGLQVVATTLAANATQRAQVITPRPAGEIAPLLRGSAADVLDRVMLSCVFDMDGLWEVLADLDAPSVIQDSQDDDAEPPPSIILVTHFTSLLSSLFTQRDKEAAHSGLQLLSSHMRHLARTLPSQPLIMLLNSTSTNASDSSSKPLDPTLRSIFNPAPLAIPGYVAPPSARRNKPAFGLVFSQLLHVHLLCSRMLRNGEDPEATVTAVEVLLDDVGVWQGKMGPRPSREQRYGFVDLRQGTVVDAFTAVPRPVVTEIHTSGGFGGRRP